MFWVAALFSNCLAAAQSVIVLWLLSDTSLPVSILLMYQASGIVGTLIGLSVGIRVSMRLGHSATVAASSLLQALAAVFLAWLVWQSPSKLDFQTAIQVCVLLSLLPLAAGLAGPSWIALVSTWPATRGQVKHILLDSVQFQLGKALGPLLGGLLLATLTSALPAVAIANALSYICISMIMILRGLQKDPREIGTQAKPIRSTLRGVYKAWPLWGVALVAFTTDTARTYMAKLMHQQGLDHYWYSVAVSLTAAAAVAATWGATRARFAPQALAVVATGLSAGALLLWAGTSYLGPWCWWVGAVLIGLGAPLAGATYLAILVSHVGLAQKAVVAGSSMAIRTLAGSASGLLLAYLVGYGSIAFMPLGLLALIGTGIFGRMRARQVAIMGDP